MTVRVVEIDAAAAVEVVDFTRPLATEICVMRDASGADAGECRVELGVADQESEVPRVEVRGVGKIEGYPVVGLDRHKVAPFGSCLQVQDVGEELGGCPFVLRRDVRVVQLDTHLCAPLDAAYRTPSASRDR